MDFCLFIIITAAFLRSHGTVAPSPWGGQQTLGGMQVHSSPYSGPMNGADLSFDFSTDAGWSTMWTGDSYQLRHRQNYGEDGDCTEELLLIWHEGKVGKTFKKKCTPNQSFNVNNYRSVLIFGNKDNQFRVFCSRKNEYYYKKGGKWTKGNIIYDKIQEQEMSLSDATKLEERINKWVDIFNMHNEKTHRIGDQQRKESEEYSEEMKTLSNLMKDENSNYQNNKRVVDGLRSQEYQRQQEDDRIYNEMIRNQGWNNNVQNFLNEKLRRQQEGNKRIQAKHDKELARYMGKLNKLQQKMSEITTVYNQVTTPKFQRMYNEENTRLDQDYNTLIAHGY